MGDVDLLGEVKGIGNYDDLVKDSLKVDLDGYSALILSIPGLIVAKMAAVRPKDEAGLKILYALSESEKEED
jgi:predicted nucleotidyltransferase